MYVFDLGADSFAQWLLSVGSTTLCEDREAITLGELCGGGLVFGDMFGLALPSSWEPVPVQEVWGIWYTVE